MSTAARRPFRFAVQAYSAPSGAAWRTLARTAEDLGYSTLHLADHYIGPGPMLDPTNHPVQELAAVPAMVSAADATTTLRVGCRVFCNDYHHPVMLVKEAATLDYLSGGRLEFGIGAGWIRNEYAAAGFAFDEFAQRFARLAEFVHAYKAFMSGEPLEIAGDFIRWSGFHGTPAPVQAPHPPLMIGGGSQTPCS